MTLRRAVNLPIRNFRFEDLHMLFEESHPSIIFDWVMTLATLICEEKSWILAGKRSFFSGITSSQSRRCWPEHLVRMSQAGWCGVGVLGMLWGNVLVRIDMISTKISVDFLILPWRKLKHPWHFFVHLIFTKVSWFVLHRLQISIE